MKNVRKFFKLDYLNGVRMSHLSQILFGLFITTSLIGIIGELLSIPVMYKVAMILMIIEFPLLSISHYLDRRREKRIEQQKHAENVRSCPPEFFQPAKAASAEIDTRARYAAYDVPTARYIGEITAQQLASLIHAQEEWGLESNDIPIMPETIVALKELGASPDLLKFLRRAVGTNDEIELRWIKLNKRG